MKSFMQRIKDRKNPKPVGIASADVERARSPKEGETTDNKPKTRTMWAMHGAVFVGISSLS